MKLLGLSLLGALVALPVLFWVYESGSRPSATPAAAQASPAGAEAERWAFFRRPMASPRRGTDTACPAAAPVFYQGTGSFVGTGPVYTSTGADGVATVIFRPGEYEEWGFQKFAFLVDASYAGEVLVRGGGYFAQAELRFGEGPGPATEAHLGLESDVWSEGLPEGSRLFVTTLRAAKPGCYYLQFDGLDFSARAVVEVRTEGP